MGEYDLFAIKNYKAPLLAFAGNILDYYDFLLFVHLGYLILPLFTPVMDDKSSHLLGLFLFGILFIVRPIGAYVIGRISDLDNRRKALSQSVLWAGIATLGLAFLPTYDMIGIFATILLIACRMLQGMSVAGEYPTAGTYLMESFPQHRGLLSGILSASGSLGSLLAFGFAWFCMQEGAPSWLWRVAFFLGGIASLISYFLRKNLTLVPKETVVTAENIIFPRHVAIITTLLLGVILSIFGWLPTTYSNFYLTKILDVPAEVGMMATLIAIIPPFFLKPIFGKVSDYYLHFSYLYIASFLTIPLVLIGFYMLAQANIWGQIPLVIVAAIFQGPVHAIMNKLFTKEHRSRSINLFFISGACIGGLAPSLFGWIVDTTGWHYFPAFSCMSIALTVGLVFFYFSSKHYGKQ